MAKRTRGREVRMTKRTTGREVEDGDEDDREVRIAKRAMVK